MSSRVLLDQSATGLSLRGLQIISHGVQDAIRLGLVGDHLSQQVFAGDLHDLPCRIGTDLEDRVQTPLISCQPH